LKARLIDKLLTWLREWDRATAGRVTHFIANSHVVQKRIRECYERSSVVIYPPVSTDYYTPAQVPREPFYLVVSAFAPYKRLDLAIAACNRLGRRLMIIGTGQDEKHLRNLAGPTIHFLGWQSDGVIRDHLRRCQALLFPGEEDFGIVPVEAQACGTPVICYGKGGVTETVRPLGRVQEPTGIWFEDQCVESLIAGLQTFEDHRQEFRPSAARRQALKFNLHRFETELFDFVSRVLEPAASPERRAA
jgi:glycosyltransferase involved in cell wall biosynthesis